MVHIYITSILEPISNICYLTIFKLTIFTDIQTVSVNDGGIMKNTWEVTTYRLVALLTFLEDDGQRGRQTANERFVLRAVLPRKKNTSLQLTGLAQRSPMSYLPKTFIHTLWCLKTNVRTTWPPANQCFQTKARQAVNFFKKNRATYVLTEEWSLSKLMKLCWRKPALKFPIGRLDYTVCSWRPYAIPRPVHLGDSFNGGRYTILHKFG